MTKEIKKQLQIVAKRYAKHGVTLSDCITLYNDGINHGIDGKSAVIGLRLSLSRYFGESEYFTAEDVATVTGETVEQVNKRIKENKDELMKNGHIVEVSSPFFQ
ncbi:MAG: hypothetical protein K2G63_04380 [Oscillospiraceae bacterium]|nr:hypothetical protein [Oscillospiraceae bacterium]